MPDINFDCPVCGHNLEVSEKGAGMTVPCPECSNTITAIVVPHDAELKRGVIEYVLEHYSKSGLPCNSVEVVFTYLKHNRIRISLKSSLRRIIQQYFKLDE